jgi:hypothetical protein
MISIEASEKFGLIRYSIQANISKTPRFLANKAKAGSKAYK